MIGLHAFWSVEFDTKKYARLTSLLEIVIYCVTKKYVYAEWCVEQYIHASQD